MIRPSKEGSFSAQGKVHKLRCSRKDCEENAAICSLYTHQEVREDVEGVCYPYLGVRNFNDNLYAYMLRLFYFNLI